MAMTEKLAHLKELLREMDGAVVAFSSGVDSTFLLRVAHEVLGERVIAATIRSHTFPKREMDEAVAFCRAEGVRHEVIDSEELDIPGFALQEIAPDSIPVNVLHPIEGTPLGKNGILDHERVVDSVAILRLVNPSTPLRFAGGRRDMSDETAAKCIYVGMSAGIAGPLLTTPGADFADDRELAVRAGYAVGYSV